MEEDRLSSLCESEGLRTGWYVVALSSDVDEQPLGVTLLGDKFVLWRSDGAVVAAPDRCPHREAPLSAGSVKDGLLTCAYHGWAFGGQGQCMGVPSSTDPKKVPSRGNLETCEIRDVYGLIWLCPGRPSTKFPEIQEDSDPNYHRLNTPMQRWNTSATRMVDNFMDTAHFAFVHSTSIGAGIDPTVEDFDIERLDDCFTGYAYNSYIANPPEAQAMNGDLGPTTTVRVTTGFCLPTTVRGTMAFHNQTRQVLLILCTPVDDDNALFTFVLWRSDDSQPDDEVVDFELKINNEDRAMLELLDGPLPLTPGSLVSVRSDKGSEVWRREFTKLHARTAPNPRDTS
jgi:phenylpropionate dioxygenase-like ring-hydroxylating dioxygenase large terminal subunit